MNSVHALLASTALSLIAAGAAAQNDAGPRTYSLNCGQNLGEVAANRHVCRQLHITDGAGMELRAGLVITSELSEVIDWRRFTRVERQLLEGILIRFDDAELVADSVTLHFADGELVQFELIGSPAVMTHLVSASNNTRIRAEASRMIYDGGLEEIEWLDVRFTDGSEGGGITACAMRYNLRTTAYSVEPRGDCVYSLTLTGTSGGDSREDPPPGEP